MLYTRISTLSLFNC